MKAGYWIATALAAGGMVVAGPATLASATAQTMPANQLPPQVLTPLAGGVTNNGCPDAILSDWGVLVMNSGNAVTHDSTNKNGDWGGDTVEGNGTITQYTTAPADPTNPTSLPTNEDDTFGPFTGHVTQWGGGGFNHQGQNQNEGGFTFSFHGVSAGGMTVDVQLHAHQTTNNNGTPTANVFGGTITCS